MLQVYPVTYPGRGLAVTSIGVLHSCSAVKVKQALPAFYRLKHTKNKYVYIYLITKVYYYQCQMKIIFNILYMRGLRNQQKYFWDLLEGSSVKFPNLNTIKSCKDTFYKIRKLKLQKSGKNH